MPAPHQNLVAQVTAGPVPPAGRGRVAEHLVLLTRDASLVEALAGAVPAESLTVVADEASLGQHLMGGLVGVVFLDAAMAHAPGATAQLTQRLHQQFPDVVLVVAGDGAAQSELAAQVGDGTIYRFAHQPVSAQRVKLFVDAAWRRREGASGSGAYPALSNLAVAAPAALATPARDFTWPAVLVSTVALGAGAAWLLLRATPHEVNVPPAASPRAIPLPLPEVPAAVNALARKPEQAQRTARRRADAAAAARITPATSAPAPLPVVAVSATFLAPSSTPPASEARDPTSIAAVILERVYSVDPEFPEIARERDLSGYVDLEFTVNADGTVTDVSVLKAEPRDVFEKAAVEAVSQWRYRPVLRDGQPASEHARLRLNFAYR